MSKLNPTNLNNAELIQYNALLQAIRNDLPYTPRPARGLSAPS